MADPASEVYEIVLEDTGTKRNIAGRVFEMIGAVMSLGRGTTDPGGVIVSVRRIDDGTELFRHIEDGGDDDDHLVVGIRNDLATMTAAEFKNRWNS